MDDGPDLHDDVHFHDDRNCNAVDASTESTNLACCSMDKLATQLARTRETRNPKPESPKTPGSFFLSRRLQKQRASKSLQETSNLPRVFGKWRWPTQLTEICKFEEADRIFKVKLVMPSPLRVNRPACQKTRRFRTSYPLWEGTPSSPSIVFKQLPLIIQICECGTITLTCVETKFKLDCQRASFK